MARVRIDEALAWLESHVNLEAMETGRYRVPTLARISELCGLMADPHDAYPAIHITGTNGKGSVARMVSDLLTSVGLSVGTYTSPDLESITERFSFGGSPIETGELAELLGSLAQLEPLMGERPSRFEILTAAAFRWFADRGVDAAVVEVGLGGTWDATNIVDAQVAVVTNVELDHVEMLGPTRAQIAAEKAGIVKNGSVLVLGEDDPELRPIFDSAASATGADVVVVEEDFGCERNELAVGGRLVDLRVPGGVYEDIFLPLHGAHQGDNAAAALAAVDAFLGSPLSPEVVEEGFARVAVPGRLEIVAREPLVVLDGAHNPAGASCAGAALEEEFSSVGGIVVVMGLLRGRDPREMLEALGPARISSLIACPAPSPRSARSGDIAAAARSLGLDAVTVPSVADGIEAAVQEASGRDRLVLVTGSLYVVGAARTELRARLAPAG